MTKNILIKSATGENPNPKPMSEAPPPVEVQASDHPLSAVLIEFLDGMSDLEEAIYISIPSIGKQHSNEISKLGKVLAIYEDSSGEMQLPESDPHGASNMLMALDRFTRIAKSNALEVLERSLFVGLFSQYDVFVGMLLKGLYALKPDLYKSISREITLTDLLNFDSLSAVKNDMLEKEVDSFKRESYITQFEILEKKFAIPLRKFQEWPEFVELSQRRNLMTHTGGVVSEQYISLCEREGFKFEKRPEVGSTLGLGEAYFSRSIYLLSKIAFMLTQTLWRKVAQKDVATADQSLNSGIYDFLKAKNWLLAAELGEFSLSPVIVANSREMDIRIRVINTAIALTRLKRQKEALKLLDSFDWSACIREFKLADAILRGKTTEACQIMTSIGRKGELIEQLSYHQWPLFEDCYDSKEFQEAYFSIYSIPFIEKATQTTVSASEVSKIIAVPKATTPKKLRPNTQHADAVAVAAPSNRVRTNKNRNRKSSEGKTT